jgi:FkbM family methyltransferase
MSLAGAHSGGSSPAHARTPAPRRAGFDSRRLAHLVQKRLRALRLGVWLGRTANFTVPESVIVNGERKRIYVPDDVGTRLIFLEVLIADCYRLGDVSEPVRTVLDIGANVGLFCLGARNVFPDAMIHAYEPNPDLEPYLRAQAGAARCDYFMEAVGIDDGHVVLEKSDYSGLTRSTPVDSGGIRRIAFAKAIQRLGGNVDLVKVDCEGSEWQFLHDRDAWRRVRNVAMEYHLWKEHSHQDIRNALSDMGFFIRDQDAFTDSGLIFASRQAD